MLTYLHIRGLALLDDVTLGFEPGMNVLTGETGAGKSIIVGALSLLRGARGRADLVRAGQDSAIVDAQFDPDSQVWPRVAAVLREHGLVDGAVEDDDDSAIGDDGLLVRRVVAKSGRGRSFLQSALTTQGVLAQMGELLLDICSQHEHHFLTHASRHLEVLDAYAKLAEARAEHAQAYTQWRRAEGELHELRDKANEAGARADYLRFQIDELEQVDPEPGEYERLRRRLSLLRDAQRWAEFARDAHDMLYESDDAIASRLARLLERARGGGEGSELLAEIEEQLAAAQIACEEAAHSAARFAGELELEPGALDLAEERMHELEGLRRKHGVEIDALADKLQQMRVELEAVGNVEEHLQALQERVDELHWRCVDSARALHERRVEAADGLAEAVVRQLEELHMAGARIEVRVQVSEPDRPGPRGIDEVEFLLAANPGEPLAPLSRVASGGELSRVLLAIKGALTREDRVATYVFDEVDAGVGGAVAEAIGRRLKSTAAGHQVLCVTHLPQIAAFADAHYRVDKVTRKGRTVTRVAPLSEEQRVEELARMLGGDKDSARAHAKQLLVQARGGRKRGRGGKRTARV